MLLSHRRRIAASILLAILLRQHASAQLPFGGNSGQNPFGQIGEQLKERLFMKAASALLNNELPVKLDATTTFPTVDVLPGGAFAPRHLELTPDVLNAPLPPGDYSFNVLAFCTEYSVHRPGRGVAYKLAPLQGKASSAVATLLWRGAQAGVPPRHLMSVAWTIQSGLTYSQMPQTFEATIDRLIPDHKSELSGDFIQRIEDTYQKTARGTNLPPLDTLLARMGGPGQLVLAAKRQREALLAKDTTDEIREQRLFAGQESGVYTPVRAEEGPWTVRIPGVAYMRYKIEGGNLEGNNIIEIRILPSTGQTARLSTEPHILRTALVLSTSAIQTPTVLNLLGVEKSADGVMNATGLIGYAQGQGAQALIPVIPPSPVAPNPQPTTAMTIYLGGAGGDAPYIQDQVSALQESGVKNVFAGKFSGGMFSNLAEVPWLTTRRKVDLLGVEIPWTLHYLSLSDNGQALNFIGYSYGSLIAAQCAAYYADAGRQVHEVVLIGSPISRSFLEELQHNKNIGKVIVINLTQYGDQIYAGMPLYDVTNPLTLEAIGLQDSIAQDRGLGHFYFAPNNSIGRDRRRVLAATLWNSGIR